MEDQTRVRVVKVIGDYSAIVPATVPVSYSTAVAWISGKRYYGMYAIQDIASGRLLSHVVTPTWKRKPTLRELRARVNRLGA